MKFYSQKISEACYEVILLGRENEVLFHLRAPEDTIASWHAGFQHMMAPGSPYSKQRRQLIDQASYLHECELQTDASPLTFLRVICALLKSLKHLNMDGVVTAQQEIHRLLRLQKPVKDRPFNFRAFYTSGAYEYGLLVNEPMPILGYHLEDAKLPSIPREWWLVLIPECRHNENEQGSTGQDTKIPASSKLRDILVNYQLLQEIVVQQTRILGETDETQSFILCSFANFSKALIEFLDTDQSGEFVTFRRETMFDLCSFIVENEFDNLEEQKPYLERILQSKELAPDAKFERLCGIVEDLQEDSRQNPARNESRLTAVIGAISEYYLDQYNLERAAAFWQLLDKKDWLLHGILSFYRLPHLFAIGALLLTGLISLRIYFPITTGVGIILSWLAGGILAVTFSLILFGLGFMVWRFFITRRGLEYVDLLLPRLLGASVVGLSVLLVEDKVWRFSLNVELLNWILICLAVYTFSFVYIFIDVHKILRLLPLPGEIIASKAGPAKDSSFGALPQNINPMRPSIEASFKVFFISLFESFLAVLFTSTLFYRVVLSPEDIHQLTTQGLGLELQINGLYSLGFFPKLVLLWTGLVMFVGAFVQLIWQDRRITSS